MQKAAWGLTGQELRDALVHAFAEKQRWAARCLELVREVDGQNLAHDHGATSTTAWLNAVLQVTPTEARKMIATAAALDHPCAVTAKALSAGAVNEAQAAVIGRCVTSLAEHGPDKQAEAEQFLLDKAAEHDAHALTVMADRILFVIDPEAAEEHQRKNLDAAEKRAARDRFFTLSPDGTGRTRLTGVLGAEAAAIVRAALEPLCRPTDPHDHRSAGQRRADALTDICALALATGQLPDNRGEKAQVVVTTRFDPTHQNLSEGMLDTGETLSAETVRRLACDARIIPAMLGSPSQPLDLGREQRLFKGPLRRALILRDGGCAFPGCDRPPQMVRRPPHQSLV
ncbi:DUF222 domain-containing protein [Rhizocola hellebori]|uniref:DUF222 domain-containing protein n=1 Tax=Rhizocola hellebori TaxID=1392758 RepID=UPI001943267C|nr:DUF222 domain-containing protein [Rhizocola hellebori]